MLGGSFFRRFWNGLRRGIPGRRFQDRYDRARRHRDRIGWWRRATKIAIGLLAFGIGLVEIIFPGPAVLFFLLSGTLLATESLTMARVMDWMEVHGRQLWTWAHRTWNSFSTTARIGVVIVLLALLTLAGVVAHRLLWR